MTATFRDYVAILTGSRLPIIRASSAHLAVNYPCLLETGIIDPATGLKVPGLPVGTCGLKGSGGVMYWDPVQVFKTEGVPVQNTNVNEFGEVGEGKSASVKGEIALNAELGRNTIVIDIKGEYSEAEEDEKCLADIIPGSKVLRFGGDTSLRLNMLDEIMSRESQHDLAQQVVLSALGTNRTYLQTAERDALWYGMQEAHQRSKRPILRHLNETIDDPSEGMIEDVIGHRAGPGVARAEFEQAVMELRSTLKRLDTGNLRGIFHEHTTPGLFEVVPFLAINCKRLSKERLAVMIVMLNFLLYDVVKSRKNAVKKFDFVVHEEAWDLVKIPPYLESMVRLNKLGNSEGISSKLVSHHPSNLYGLTNREQVDSLLTDVGTNILFRLDAEEASEYATRLRLNDVELDVVSTKLKPREALYKVGDLPGIRVQHTITNHPLMRSIVETRRELRK